jgi:hypothetical protein
MTPTVGDVAVAQDALIVADTPLGEEPETYEERYPPLAGCVERVFVATHFRDVVESISSDFRCDLKWNPSVLNALQDASSRYLAVFIPASMVATDSDSDDDLMYEEFNEEDDEEEEEKDKVDDDDDDEKEEDEVEEDDEDEEDDEEDDEDFVPT